jgi:ribosome maturation factor RimP
MATTYERERKLHDEIAPRVERDLPGVDVLAVELMTPSRFCVYVDHPDGVDHALCGRVTDLLRDYLREYTVDVSSPGIERPLRRTEHFAAVVGRRVRVRTADGTKAKGVVVAAEGDFLALGAEGGERQIPYGEIVRANLIDEGMRE